jgi:hypothetical protein
MSGFMSDDEVKARVELRWLVDEYAWRTDQYDYEGYADLFTDDGQVSAVNPGETEPFFDVSGREALVGVVHGNDQFVRTFHAVENHRVVFNDDGTASGVAYCTAHHLQSEEADATTLIMLIRYHDEYARTDAGWRFKSRCLRMAWIEHVRADVSAYPFQGGSADWIEKTY